MVLSADKGKEVLDMGQTELMTAKMLAKTAEVSIKHHRILQSHTVPYHLIRAPSNTQTTCMDCQWANKKQPAD